MRDQAAAHRDRHAEKAVLGAVILQPDILTVLDCTVDYFDEPRNRAVWSTLSDLAADGVAIDTLTLEARLRKSDLLDAIGGLAYISELALVTPTVDNVDHYLAILREHLVTRRVLRAFSSLQRKIQQGYASGLDLADQAVAELSRVDRFHDAAARKTGELAMATFEKIGNALLEKDTGEQVFAGVPSGIGALNELTGGYPISVLTVIGGLPGAGKSTHSINEADLAAHKGYGAHILTYEDGPDTYGHRLLSREADLPVERLRALDLNRQERSQLALAAERIARRPPFLVEHVQGVKVDEVVRRVRGRARENNTRIVFVDYIQNMPAPSHRMKKHEAIEANLESLEVLAGQDELAVVVYSQLNSPTREGFKKWTPSASEFFGGRVIHHKAKLMIALKYPADHNDEAPPNLLELHVLKNHQGQTGVLEAHYNRSRGLIRGVA